MQVDCRILAESNVGDLMAAMLLCHFNLAKTLSMNGSTIQCYLRGRFQYDRPKLSYILMFGFYVRHVHPWIVTEGLGVQASAFNSMAREAKECISEACIVTHVGSLHSLT